jgi:hypothetical protein
MGSESIHDDDALIDVDDTYVDGDELPWSIVSVDMNEQTVSIECLMTPLRTVPAADLEKMKRRLTTQWNEALASGVVAVGIGGIYEDQDHLLWTVKVVNLRDRTVGIKLMNPPRRTISLEQLREMRSRKRGTDQSIR